MANQCQKINLADKKDKLINKNNNTHNVIASKTPYEAKLSFKLFIFQVIIYKYIIRRYIIRRYISVVEFLKTA